MQKVMEIQAVLFLWLCPVEWKSLEVVCALWGGKLEREARQ